MARKGQEDFVRAREGKVPSNDSNAPELHLHAAKAATDAEAEPHLKDREEQSRRRTEEAFDENAAERKGVRSCFISQSGSPAVQFANKLLSRTGTVYFQVAAKIPD